MLVTFGKLVFQKVHEQIQTSWLNVVLTMILLSVLSVVFSIGQFWLDEVGKVRKCSENSSSQLGLAS